MVNNAFGITYESDKVSAKLFVIAVVLFVLSLGVLYYTYTLESEASQNVAELESGIQQAKAKYRKDKAMIEEFYAKAQRYKTLLKRVPFSDNDILDYISNYKGIRVVSLQTVKDKKSKYKILHVLISDPNKDDFNLIRFLVELKKHYIYSIGLKGFYLSYGVLNANIEYFVGDKSDLEAFNKLMELKK